MELSKLYYVYGLDTSCFYTDEENKLEQSLFKARQMKNKLKKKLKNEDIGLHKQYRHMIKFINKYINDKKQQLKELIESNKDLVRNVRKEKMYTKQGDITLRRMVSIFDSTLTRLFELKEQEFNPEILIVNVYFFGVAQSIVENGFYMNGEKYVFFSSSAGQIRTKKMVCVKESLLKKHWNTLTCGLTIDHINSLDGMNINKYLAYLALCNSATEHWTDFDIKKAIVVEDFENCVRSYVDYIDDITYEVTRRTENVPIPHTDGCGIMLPSVSKKNFMIRLPWFKGLLGVFDFRKFIEENNCSPVVTDIYGTSHNVIAEDIQIIFTKSQFKMWSYFESWSQYVNNFIKYHCQAGVCNIEEDEMFKVTINYQMIQSLIDITNDELSTLCKESSDFIESLARDSQSMLKAFGATSINHRKNAFQNCLMKYPELLSDPFCRESLKDIKRSLEKDLWSAKFRVNGYYTFILPDLYAFCEHLFNGEEYPEGLLKNNEVHCSLLEFEKEVDCLRSPHLYMEHAIRDNVNSGDLKKWFTTKALYTSCHDIISKVLMFDVDGDMSLVVQDDTLIGVAKRNMIDVIPLYYDMKKATKEPITNSNLFKGLNLAYTGGNIGIYSNDISKIKNSNNMLSNSESYNEALTCIKWLCLENNQTIDYAKTLYKSKRPDNVDSIIKKYTQEKLPFFFVYAKDKEESQVEKTNNSPVNRIRQLFPPKKINYNFKKDNIGYFDYHVLMSNPSVERNQEIIETFKKLAKNIKHNITGYDKDGNYLPIITDIKNQMNVLGYDNTYICDVLVKELFGTAKSADKRAFWHIYGDIVYENICNNINNNFIQCERCKKRFYIETHNQKYCKKCLKKINKLSLVNKKILQCCDCGKEIEVDRRAVNKVRCDICQNNYRKDYFKKYFTNKSQ